MRQWILIGCVAFVFAIAGCGGDDAGSGTKTDAGTDPAPAPAGGAGEPAPAAATADLSTPRGSIEYQLSLLQAGNLEALKACFTPRLQNRITAQVVSYGAEEAAEMTMDDLFASMTEGEYEGKKTAKVMMKNGRTLTTLVLTDGKWLADTIWFK